MDADVLARLLVRRAQIAASLRIVGWDVGPAEPLLRWLGPELVASMAVGSAAHWPHVTVTTPVRPDRSRAVTSVLLQIGAPAWLQEVVARREPRTMGLRFVRDGETVEPVLSLDPGDGPVDAFRLLREVGVRQAELVLGLARTLLASRLRDVGLDSAVSGPRWCPRFAWTLAPDQHLGHGERLREVADGMGIAEPHARWIAATLGVFAIRPVNEVDVALAFDAAGPRPWLALTYREVPTSWLLRLLADLAPEPHDGRRLGAVAGALGVEDVVAALRVEVAADRPPTVGFELVSDRVPLPPP